MDEEMKDRLTSFLKSKGTGIAELPKSRVGQLQLIDRVIEQKLHATKEALATLKANEVSVSAVSDQSGISRKTFYNNPLLLDYVSHCKELAQRMGPVPRIPKEQLEKTKALRIQLDKMLRRDVDMEELKMELGAQRKTIQSREKQIAALEKANARLRTQLRHAHEQLPKAKGKIIEFESD